MKPPPSSPPANSRDPDAVCAMFGRIARRYDLANHLLSGGADFLWRYRAARKVASWRPQRILDLATGSGDLALAISRRLPGAVITGADFSPEMLAIARVKGLRDTVVADALHLPFPEGAFDCVTVAFGLRNMVDWSAALREIARVLIPHGQLLVLDFSIPAPPARALYRFYLHRCLPWLAALLTGQKDAYDYLGASIEKFPNGEAMLSLIESNGFTKASAEKMAGGVVTMYEATKSLQH